MTGVLRGKSKIDEMSFRRNGFRRNDMDPHYGPPSYECGVGSVMHGYNMPALERENFKRLDLGVHKI